MLLSIRLFKCLLTQIKCAFWVYVCINVKNQFFWLWPIKCDWFDAIKILDPYAVNGVVFFFVSFKCICTLRIRFEFLQENFTTNLHFKTVFISMTFFFCLNSICIFISSKLISIQVSWILLFIICICVVYIMYKYCILSTSLLIQYFNE